MCCDHTGAIALAQGEGSWRTKTLVAKMRAIRSHLNAGYIRVSYIETSRMLADILMKFLGPKHTRDALESLGVLDRFITMNGTFFMVTERLKTFECWASSVFEVTTVILT